MITCVQTKSCIITLDNGDRFIEPQISDLCPEFWDLIQGKKSTTQVIDRYHCNRLYQILFRSANHASENVYFTERIVCNLRGFDDDIYYHINELLGKKCPTSTIIDWSIKFQALCEQFLTRIHPLSVKLNSQCQCTEPIQTKSKSKSSIGIPNIGEKQCIPSFQNFCPGLYALIRTEDKSSDNYHCGELYKILHGHKSDVLMLEKQLRYDIYYHINGLLQWNHLKSTIIDQCNKFEALIL
jgi:hypothetical protein